MTQRPIGDTSVDFVYVVYAIYVTERFTVCTWQAAASTA
jgi:hypothetical protein